MTDNSISPLKLTVRIFLLIISFGLYVFLSSGTLNWPEAWIFLCLYLSSVTASVLWLRKNDPELLNERMTAKRKNNIKSWDKVIVGLFTPLFIAILVVAGLDAVRFKWSEVPLAIKIAGFVAMLFPWYIIFRVMEVNTSLSEMVRIQDERGHHVCKEGPYHYVRHPMYVGNIVLLICIPFALGSFYALIPAFLSIILFMVRTALEDKTLRQELPGYEEYTKEVRYRLFPGIW